MSLCLRSSDGLHLRDICLMEVGIPAIMLMIIKAFKMLCSTQIKLLGLKVVLKVYSVLKMEYLLKLGLLIAQLESVNTCGQMNS